MDTGPGVRRQSSKIQRKRSTDEFETIPTKQGGNPNGRQMVISNHSTNHEANGPPVQAPTERSNGEIERGEANTTLDALERLADAVGWDPMEALEGMREPVTEGVRLLMLAELRQIEDRTKDMTKWLQALDPALHPAARPDIQEAAPVPPKNRPRASRRGKGKV